MKAKRLHILFICFALGIIQITMSNAGDGVVVHRPEVGDTNFGHSVDISEKTFIASYTSYVGDLGGVYIFGMKAAVVAGKKVQKWDVLHHFLTPDDKARDWFGWDVAIDGDIAVVGAYEDGGNKVVAGGPIGEGPGAVYVYTRSGKKFGQRKKLKADDGKEKDRFGFSVDISGETLVVGAPNDDDAGADSGSAYVYVLRENQWRKQAKLVPADAAAKQWFGWDIGIAGNTVVVGAPLDKEKGRNAGAAYVFVRTGEEWKQQAKLVAADGDSSDKFGNTVDISEGNIIVGAPKDEEKGKDAGAAYIFIQTGEEWKQQQKLTASTPEVKAAFGNAVAITQHMAIVGAPFEDGVDVDAGAAYTYLRRGGSWLEKKKVESQFLRKGEVEDLTTGDNFGNAVAIDKSLLAAKLKGQILVAVGSRWDNVDGDGDRGTVYIYNAGVDLNIPLPVEPNLELMTTQLGHIKRSVLLQNFPNPFNPETWFPYMLADDASTSICIYDVHGQLIRRLDYGIQQAGNYLSKQTAAYWDGKGQLGEHVSSGVYFYTLQAETFRATRRMVILK